MNVHDPATARVLAGFGISRVTLAREMSLPDVAGLAADIDIEVETFVHGALCFCYSGQCLMSSMIGGRSGNRGMCAQPCRMRYELIDAEGTARDVPGPYLLSPKDLAAIEVLPELIDAGVSALKVEGRMKSPEYVALVTGVYRRALDRAAADPEGFSATEAERETLLEAFTRGFSTAYLEGVDDDRMMSYTRPNNRGVLVGRVAQTSAGRATIALERALEAGDTVEFWTRGGRFTQRVSELQHHDGSLRSAPAGEQVTVPVGEAVARGDRVFRVVSASLQTAARRTYEKDEQSPRIPVDLHVGLVVGKPVEVTATTDDAHGSAKGPTVEPARTKNLTAEEVMEHVGRVGSTPFSARSWDVELQPGVGMSFSVLHRTRREALEDLEKAILDPWSGRTQRRASLDAQTGARPNDVPRSRPHIAVRVMDPGLVADLLVAGADTVHLPVSFAGDCRDIADPRLTLEMPRIAPGPEFEAAVGLVSEGDRVSAPTLGLLEACATRGAEVDAHWGLNIANPRSAEVLAAMGAGRVWLSPELRLEQVADTTAGVDAPCGVAVYGRQELMVTQHCVLGVGGCDGRCETCTRRGWHTLRDEKGYEFPVTSDRSGRSHICNSVPLDVTHAMGDILDAGVGAVRVDLTTESAAGAQEVVGRVRASVEAALAGAEPPPRLEGTTTGHFFRGVE
jgi:putative protease